MRKLPPAAVLAVIAAIALATPQGFPGCRASAGGPPGPDGRSEGAGGARVVLNEILPAPKAAFGGEWIELHNAGDTAADLGGWSLDDLEGGGSRPFAIPAGTSIAPGGFLLFDNATTRVALNNDGDTVRLLDHSGALADSCSYNASSYDVSIGRFPDGGPAWRSFEAPTPGASNGAPAPPGPADRSVLVSQVHYHAFSGRSDEFVAVSNPDIAFPVDLSGWSLSSGGGSAVFPEGTSLAAGATVFVTGSASDFLEDAGFLPDLETLGSRADVRKARSTGGWPALGNEGGNLSLKDANGETVDAFAWGRPFNGAGWSGPPAAALPSGVVARRLRDGGGGWRDTNSSQDWPDSASAMVGRSDFSPATFEASAVLAFASPDCSFETVAGALGAARYSILLSVYQFESWPLAQALAAACRRGVSVRVLLEGAPVEGVSDQERAVARLLHESGASVSFLASRPGSGVPARYSYLHAKYCVVDNATCIVSSENWKPTGIPYDSTFGNRGWGAVVESPGLGAWLSAVFLSDANPVMRDVIPYSPEGGTFGPPPAGFVPDTAVPKDGYGPRFSAEAFGPGVRVRPVLSPDTASVENSSVLGLIRGANRTLLVEQLSCPAMWGAGASARNNPYLEAVVEAARRGVKVRLLLDGTYLDPTDSQEENADALNYINFVAASEGLDLQARLARIPGALKLHNKGAVADGERALVSSVNWGPNSFYDNREVGLMLEGPGVAGYFERVFWDDWNASARDTGGPLDTPDDHGTQYLAQRALAISAVLVAAAVVFVLRRARRRRRRY